jgi:hypothetical protein
MDNVDILATLNEKLDLFDFAGKTKDHEDLFTRAHNVGDEIHFTRLDKILTTHALVKHIQDIKVIPTLHESDHDAVAITLRNQMDYPSKAQWYFPTEILKDPEYIKLFEDEWKSKWGNQIMTIQKWEQAKSWIREFTI